MHIHIGIAGFAAILLYSSAIAAFLISAFGRPHIGIFYVVPLLPLQTLRYRLHEYPLGANVIDIVLLGVAFGLWRSGRPVLARTPFNRLFLVYAVFTYLTLWRGAFFLDEALPLWFDNRRLQDWKNYMILPVLSVLVYGAIRSKKHIRILLLCMCFSVFLLNRSYFNTMRDRDLSHFSYEVRDEGAMGYAGVNGFAAFEAQYLLFLAGLFAFERSWMLRGGYLLLMGISIYCLLFAFSRGAYMAFIAGWLFLGVVKQRWLLIVLAVFLSAWQAAVPSSVRERIFMTEGEDGEVEHSADTRLTLWQDALQVFQADPLVGTGFNTYAYMGRVGPYRDTHNMYVKVLVETGVVGITIFLWMLYKMFELGFRLFRSATDPLLCSLGLGFSGLIVSAVIGNFFGDRWTYMQISGYTFTILGLCLRGLDITNDSQPDEEDDVGDHEIGCTPAVEYHGVPEGC